MQRILKILFLLLILNTNFANSISAENSSKLLTTDWSFKGPFGKFDRASLQRGYQVYNEVCASCHSLKYVSYRNLSEKGGPEFSVKEAKAIANLQNYMSNSAGIGEHPDIVEECSKLVKDIAEAREMKDTIQELVEGSNQANQANNEQQTNQE